MEDVVIRSAEMGWAVPPEDEPIKRTMASRPMKSAKVREFCFIRFTFVYLIRLKNDSFKIIRWMNPAKGYT